MKNLNDPRTLRQEIAGVWRVVLPVVVAELIGLALGLALGRSPDRFIDAWCGGAFGMPAGFIIGLVWHNADPARRNTQRREILVFLCFLAIALPIAALLVPKNG